MFDNFKNLSTSGNFWTGALIGGLVGAIATNAEARKAVLKYAAKGVNLVSNTFAEAKEKFADAQAEVRLEEAKQQELTTTEKA